MTTPFPFTTGQVLTAAQMNAITTLPINDQTASYTLVVGDVGKRVIMNNASATTITVNNSVFGVGDTVFIANKGAGTTTITAGAGVTVNTAGSLALTQYGGGTLVALSASTFTFFTAPKSTLSVEFLLVGGGGGGGRYGAGNAGGGGGGGGFVTGSGIIGKTTYTVKVGAAGAGTTANFQPGYNGTASAFINTANGGGGGGAERGQIGGSGGGGGTNGAGATGISGEGNNGGNAVSAAGGGGGGAGAVGAAGVSTTGGAGGNGSTNNYDGSTTTYAGGGGGGATGTGGAGGTGGGGAGGSNTNGVAGSINTGGGGGGGGGAGNGASGGSGLVIVRWLTADAAGLTLTATGTTSATPTVDGSYSWFKWTSTGTLVVA
jgi:hypothetical protein